MAAIGNQAFYPVKAGGPDRVILHKIVALGTASIGAQDGDPNITVTRTGVGAYTVTFPPCPPYASTVAGGFLELAAVVSPAATVAGHVWLTQDLSNGTATLRLYKDTSATAVEPAAGDAFVITLTASTTRPG